MRCGRMRLLLAAGTLLVSACTPVGGDATPPAVVPSLVQTAVPSGDGVLATASPAGVNSPDPTRAIAATDAVQQASVDAYESVRDTAQEQPFISGMLVGGLVGFALGALWKLESRRSLPAHMLDSFHNYADPSVRYRRNRVRW